MKSVKIFLISIVMAVFSTTFAIAQTRIATPETLGGILTDPTQGGEVLLEPGDYGAVRISGVWPSNSPLILRSKMPSDPAVFREMAFIDAAHVSVRQVIFDYRFSEGDADHQNPFRILRGQDISILGSVFDGDVAGPGVERAAAGFPLGYGLGVRDSERIAIISNSFRKFGRGIVCAEVTGLIIRGNDVSAMRSDGMNFAAVQDVAVEGNHLHDFARDFGSDDHSDMIQFWTSGTNSPSTNIRIRANLLNAGRGAYTQSILMRNERVDQGLAGREMFYRDIEISNNVILNAHLHGITVGETDGLIISNNTVVHNTLAAGQDDPNGPWVPQIRIAPMARDVIIARNIAPRFTLPGAASGWQITRNVEVQSTLRTQAGFAATLFGRDALVRPDLPSSFAPRPGGPLDGSDVGATWLGPDVTGPPTDF